MSKQEAIKGVTVGDILAGKYRVEKVLGMGGMGVVVAATHLDLREMRAIKLIRPDAESDQSIERFLREARAVVRLRSEHVAEVYDVGRLENGAPYIVMEPLEGQDLSAMLKARGPLPIEEAVLYVTQACHALAEAHSVGIVHRDLKPGNLFVTRRADGSACVKVLDFGISKHTNPDGMDPEMTGARDLIGSPLYMSPEQMRAARKVDPRADVWGLGAILYKLLTGRAPFHAPTVPEIFALTLGKPVRPPSALRPQISSELDAIIMRCLDKQLQNRYPTAAELGAALMPHGPWEPSASEAANQLFSTAPRRTSVPPEPPTVHQGPEMPEREELLPPVNAPGYSETGDPMSGLARSAKIVRTGPISTWGTSPSRSPLRPGWLAFTVVLSISSAFVGATIVGFVARTTTAPLAAQPVEIAHTTREQSPPAAVPPAPLPATISSAAVQETSTNVITKAPSPSSYAPKAPDKLQFPQRPRLASSAASPSAPATSAEPKVPVHVPAKPETAPKVEDQFPRRE